MGKTWQTLMERCHGNEMMGTICWQDMMAGHGGAAEDSDEKDDEEAIAGNFRRRTDENKMEEILKFQTLPVHQVMVQWKMQEAM